MRKGFPIIKKSRLPYLAVFLLLLVILELFCPVFCDEPSFAAELNARNSVVGDSLENTDNSEQASISECRHQNSGDHQQNVCNDECFCHAFAISAYSQINLKEFATSRNRIGFSYSNPVLNSLPPPFQPPKNS